MLQSCTFTNYSDPNLTSFSCTNKGDSITHRCFLKQETQLNSSSSKSSKRKIYCLPGAMRQTLWT